MMEALLVLCFTLVACLAEVTTLAGTGAAGFIGDGAGSDVRFQSPRSLALDGRGNVLVGDYSNNRIRMVWAAGGTLHVMHLPSARYWLIAVLLVSSCHGVRTGPFWHQLRGLPGGQLLPRRYNVSI